ncbi:TonB-dependent receptor domain-containing protein [Carnimonas bestiolae]|uniref:TonB-dependent receptor domain-containing protein n=1 Tax=Carnimonas bestiolae TaxID=3402172 RepID=UPI003EDC7D47
MSCLLRRSAGALSASTTNTRRLSLLKTGITLTVFVAAAPAWAEDSSTAHQHHTMSGEAQRIDRLEPVVVTAVAPSSPLTVITNPKQPRQPAPASDGADYLLTIPGFAMIRNGGSNGDPVFRGMFGSRLKVLTNGAEMLGACPARMDAPTSYIAPESYDKITLVKGPESVLWGPGASAGTVHFDRGPEHFDKPGARAEGGLMVGTYGRFDRRAEVAAGNKEGYLRIDGTKSEANDYKDGAGDTVPSKWNKWSGDVALGWTPDEDTWLELSAGRGNGEARYAGRGMDGSKFLRETAAIRFEKQNMTEHWRKLEVQANYAYADHIMDNFTLRRPSAMGMDHDMSSHMGHMHHDMSSHAGHRHEGHDMAAHAEHRHEGHDMAAHAEHRHDGHDMSSHAGHMHEGHDMAAHAKHIHDGHDMSSHAGHMHEGHDMAAHAEHIHDGHDMAAHAGHMHEGHDMGDMPMSGDKMAMELDRRTRSARVASTWEWSNLTWIAGADANHQDHRGRNSSYDMTGRYIGPGDFPWNKDYSYTQYGLFSQLSWYAAERSRVISGARIDHYHVSDKTAGNATSGNSRNKVLPSAFMRYEQDISSQPVTWYAGIGHVERFPDYWETRPGLSGPHGSQGAFSAIKPEKTTQLDVGAQYEGERAKAWISAYAGYVSDFILFDYRHHHHTYVSNVDATIAGAELGGSYQLAPHWKTEATLAYAWGRDTTNNDPLPQMPPLESRLGLTYNRGDYMVGGLWRLVAPQHRTANHKGNVTGQDLGSSSGFSVFSLNGSYQIDSHFTLSTGVDNVFDKTYTEHLNLAGNSSFGFPANTAFRNPGRMYWAKLGFEF